MDLMCLIIDRNPGVSVPLDMLKIACDINRHGYGMSFVKKVKGQAELRFIKKVKIGKDNDPKDIQSVLEEFKEYRVFLHLRHSTVGAINEENAHPFFPLLKPQDKIDLGVMHNGTLYDWKPTGADDGSDSRNFAMNFIRPLAERTAAFVGAGNVLKDPFFISRVEKEAGLNSIFLIFDNLGNVLRVNEKQGKQHEGWWSSNQYSFDNNHHRSSSKASWNSTHNCWQKADGTLERWGQNYYPGSNGDDSDGYYYGKPVGEPNSALPWEKHTSIPKSQAWEKWNEGSNNKEKPKPGTSVPVILLPAPPPKPSLREQHLSGISLVLFFTQEVKDSIMNKEVRAAQGDMTAIKDLGVKRKTFLEETGLVSLKDVGRLTVTQLEDACVQFPKGVAQLIVDLLAALPEEKKA